MKFKIEDRIRVKNEVEGLFMKDMTGTICHIKDCIPIVYGVSFDERVPDDEGHDCAGHCYRYYGRYCSAYEIELIKRKEKKILKEEDLIL